MLICTLLCSAKHLERYSLYYTPQILAAKVIADVFLTNLARRLPALVVLLVLLLDYAITSLPVSYKRQV